MTVKERFCGRTIISYISLQDHLDSSGTDGRRVQEFLQSLPPAPHARNDFSDLGIQAPGQQAAASLSDNLDNISVISATAAVQVQTQVRLLDCSNYCKTTHTD